LSNSFKIFAICCGENLLRLIILFKFKIIILLLNSSVLREAYTSEEQIELEKRMIEIADKFVELDKLVLIKLTGGYSPIFGIKEEIISNRKVMVLMLGGDCVTNEMERKQEKIYSLFNEQMTKNIAE
jgi:hypothetical protein